MSNEPCPWCREPVGSRMAVELRRANVPVVIRIHEGCLVRQLAGSVGHQRGLCGCRDGPNLMDDPLSLSLREAAMEAWGMFLYRAECQGVDASWDYLPSAIEESRLDAVQLDRIRRTRLANVMRGTSKRWVRRAVFPVWRGP